MDSVFSVDDEFWLPHAPPNRFHDDADMDQPCFFAAVPSSSKSTGMARSSSECAFERFLQEADHKTTTLQSDDVVAINCNDRHFSVNQQREMAAVAAEEPPQNIPSDSEEYQALLKSRLELACAAVALTRATNGRALESAAAVAIGSQVSDSSLNKDFFQEVTQVSKLRTKEAVHEKAAAYVIATSANGRDSQVEDSGGPVGVPPLPAVLKKHVVQVRSTSSGSSVEQSEDDEAEGETGATQTMNPADTKCKRRMLSNRESARRSRKRKQAHLTELETHVSQLKVENSSLHQSLNEITQKNNGAAVDNRILKADIETLRAKVTMAEGNVKRITGLNSLFSRTGVPFVATGPRHTADAAVPVQDDPNHHYYHPPSINHLTDRSIPLSENVAPKTTAAIGGNKTERNVSMHNMASLEHLDICIREGTSPSTSRGT